MLAGLLGGSGAVALLDVWLHAEHRAAGLTREAVVWIVGSDVAAAGAVCLLLYALARVRRGLRPDSGTAFGMGAALALLPLAVGVTDHGPTAVAVALAAGAALIALARRVRVRPAIARVLAVIPLAILAIAAAMPSSLLPRVPAGTGAQAAGRPDIVLISVATLRADALARTACTPTLNALAERGLSARFALAPSNVTLPSHITMLTGAPVLEHGVYGNRGSLPDSLEPLAERLQVVGYRTASVVSNWLVRAEAGFGRGVDLRDDAPIVHEGPRQRFLATLRGASYAGWLGLAEAPPPALERLLFGRPLAPDGGQRGNGRHTTDDALLVLRALQSGPEPYYLFVHYMDPHTPYTPPAESRGVCDDASRLPDAYRNGHDPLADWRFLMKINKALHDGLAGGERALYYLRDLYDAETLFVDRMIGELWREIERGGRPTVLLVTADHGEQFAENGFLAHGDSLYEPELRVPFVMVAPGVEPRRIARPPQLIDVAPTLLAAAGLRHDELPGVDLARADPPERVHLARHERQLVVRSGGWKLHLRVPEGGGVPEPVELYALHSDGGEQHDRLGEEPEQGAELWLLAAAALAEAAEARPEALDDEQRRALEALGYLDP